MGNDGGSIPDRRDLVKNKPKVRMNENITRKLLMTGGKAEQADKANQTRARWFFCALSKRKLQEPVVSCALGKLYNKDSIIEYLLDKSAYGDGETICGHIRSLKDLKKLTLSPNPARTPSPTSDPSISEHPQFICPLTLKEMNGLQPFVYLGPCGCVFSHAGLKAVAPPSSSADSEAEKELALCPQCASKYDPTQDIITLNPLADEEDVLRFAMERRRLLEPVKAKKGKKRKNASPEDDAPAAKKQEVARPSTNPSIAAASRAVVSSLAMEEAKRKAGMSAAVKSLYESADGGKRKETFMTMGTFTRYA
ncbi:hypothetical protein DXG03_007992 [Asterophora parasitica]|uniref:Replication termination factor 2 n=1 Tax=Asterophora parasitica TaxID=117018 RepID=A0A9P7G0H2_9AGAR|nr:hypothetical protein DXG03_007992 [Asterophora parasitica]